MGPIKRDEVLNCCANLPCQFQRHNLLLLVLIYSLLLLLLSRVSCVRLCVTPQTTAHQASPSLGFFKQEHWTGLPFPSPMHESEKWKWSRSVVSNSSDHMDYSLLGSSIHGIFQAKVLERDAIAFSEYTAWLLLLVSSIGSVSKVTTMIVILLVFACFSTYWAAVCVRHSLEYWG